MSHVFHRDSRGSPPVAVGGLGIYLVDSQGRSYIDASGGAAVSCLGHGHPEVLSAMAAQAEQLAFAHSSFFTTEVAERLADAIIEQAPAGLDKVYYVSGGSEAVEAALKMTRQYFIEIGRPSKHRFISRLQSYHGNTLGALAVGGNVQRRKPYQPMLMEVSFIDPCFAYHFKRDDESEFEYGQRMADQLETEILRLGADNVAGFIAETVGGATLGAVAAVPGYFKRIREICDRHEVLLILDEVMCGMGRTGTMFACAQEGITGDLITVAKGLGGGYQPIGAVVVSGRIHEAFVRGSGAFMHGHTYLAHAVACSAALAVQTIIKEQHLLERVNETGRYLAAQLEQRFGGHAQIGDIRGRGLFRAVELVADRRTKAALDPALKLHSRVKAEAMRRGLCVYPTGGTIDGVRGDHVLLAPPYITSVAEIDMIVERLGEAVDAALAAALPTRAGSADRTATVT